MTPPVLNAGLDSWSETKTPVTRIRPVDSKSDIGAVRTLNTSRLVGLTVTAGSVVFLLQLTSTVKKRRRKEKIFIGKRIVNYGKGLKG